MNTTILPPSAHSSWDMDISEACSSITQTINFVKAGHFDWQKIEFGENRFSTDPIFTESAPNKNKGFIYVWVFRNSDPGELNTPSIVYVGMTTQTVKGRMKQHITGMRGVIEGQCGLPSSIDIHGQPRRKGFGSESGGKKRLFFERVRPKEIEVWVYHCPEKSQESIKSRLRDLEEAVIWTITKEMDLTTNLKGRHWLRLNGSR